MARLLLLLLLLGTFPLKAEQASEKYADLTPIHLAALNGEVKALAAAIEKKPADLNAITGSHFCNGDGAWETPLHLAVLHGHLECVKLLLDKGADPSAVNFAGKTPLHYACALQLDSKNSDLRLDLVKALVEKKAALNTRDNLERTPLDYVSDEKLREYLIGKGAKAGKPIQELLTSSPSETPRGRP